MIAVSVLSSPLVSSPPQKAEIQRRKLKQEVERKKMIGEYKVCFLQETHLSQWKCGLTGGRGVCMGEGEGWPVGSRGGDGGLKPGT